MLYLGIDLGGTKISVSLWRSPEARGPAERLGVERWATLPGGPERNLDAMITVGRRLLLGPGPGAKGAEEARSGGAPVLEGIGISGGGPLDPVGGVILSVPNLPGWIDVPIVDVLSRALGAPARLENDANACAAAELLHGAGKGASSLAFLTCSTGIGAGLILDGRLYRGARNLAGEVGHQVIVADGLPCGCGKRGCLEAYASGSGMARRLAMAREAEPWRPSTAREAVERARAGDAWSLAFLEETAEFLAHGLANLVYTLDLDRIVLGTIPTAAGEVLFGPLRRALERRLWPVLAEGLSVLPSALWPELGDHSAFVVARDLPDLLD